MKGLFTSDWHLRKDRPRCRLDEDWIKTQREQVHFIFGEANRRNCDVFICGDLFDTPKIDPIISNMLHDELTLLKNVCYIIAGNHCLPYHQWELVSHSSLWPFLIGMKSRDMTLSFSGAAHFGTKPKETEFMFLHTLVFPSENSVPPNSGGVSARTLLERYPDATWIFTGDNHQGFHYSNKGRTLINPGCINRQAADLIDYQPICYFVDTEDAIIEIPVPDYQELVTDAYLQKESDREDRIEAFVEKIHSKENVSLSFIDNLRNALESADIPLEVKKTIEIICKEAGIEI